jgi:hypothetical protein
MKRSETTRGGSLALGLWVGALGTGLALFHSVGSGPLSAPPLDPSAWAGWLADRDAVVATVALLRVLVLALSWYLVGATAVGLIARLVRSVRGVRLADAVTIPALRRLLEASVGLTLATGVVVSALPAGVAHAGEVPAAVASDLAPGISGPAASRSVSATWRQGSAVPPPLWLLTSQRADDHADPSPMLRHDAPAPPPLRRLDVAGGAARPPGSVPDGSLASVPASGRSGREVVLRHLGPNDDVPRGTGGPAARDGVAVGPATGDGRETGAASGAASLPPGAAGPVRRPGRHREALRDAPARHEHIVAAGESLWTIARDVVADELGRAPTDAEVADYWLEMVEVQRPFLANPDDPDLIFPGERVRLPATAGRWSE